MLRNLYVNPLQRSSNIKNEKQKHTAVCTLRKFTKSVYIFQEVLRGLPFVRASFAARDGQGECARKAVTDEIIFNSH